MLNEKQKALIKEAFRLAQSDLQGGAVTMEDLIVWFFIATKIPSVRSEFENKFMMEFNGVYKGLDVKSGVVSASKAAAGPLDVYLSATQSQIEAMMEEGAYKVDEVVNDMDKETLKEILGKELGEGYKISTEDLSMIESFPPSVKEVVDYIRGCISDSLMSIPDSIKVGNSVIMGLEGGKKYFDSARIHFDIFGGASQMDIEIMLGGDVDINYTIGSGTTALMIAAELGRDDIVGSILTYAKNLDINQKDDNGNNALMLAIDHKRGGVIKVLMAHKDCDLEAIDEQGNTPLIQLVKKELRGFAFELVEKRKVKINAVNDNGHTALNYSLAQNDMTTTECLIENGARFSGKHFISDFKAIPLLIMAMVSDFHHYSRNFSVPADEIFDHCIRRGKVKNSPAPIYGAVTDFLLYFQKLFQNQNKQVLINIFQVMGFIKEDKKEDKFGVSSKFALDKIGLLQDHINKAFGQYYDDNNVPKEDLEASTKKLLHNLFICSKMHNMCTKFNLTPEKPENLEIADFLFYHIKENKLTNEGIDGMISVLSSLPEFNLSKVKEIFVVQDLSKVELISSRESNEEKKNISSPQKEQKVSTVEKEEQVFEVAMSALSDSFQGMSFQGLSFVREEKKAQAELKEDVKEQKMEVALKEKREVAPKKGPRNSVKTLDKLVDRLASFKIEPEDNRYKSPRDQYSFSARMRRGKHLSGGKSGDGR